MDQYKVTVTNKILGNSERVMTLPEIARFNKPAEMCAIRSKELDGKPCSIGMWTVKWINK